ncbi:MAG: EAL domain-containing protein [Gammaproteobacteria bacterium]
MAKRVHAKPQTDAAAASSRCRLLLVDDNPDDRALVARELRKDMQELAITEALDKAALDQALKAGGFDLVITDFQLRWITGLEVLRLVKSRCSDLPVIMFTGTGTEEVAVEAMRLGLSDYILKSPRHMQRLRRSVHAALARAGEAQARQRAENMLGDALQYMEDGFLLFDADDKLIVSNDKLRDFYPGAKDVLVPGTDFESLVKAGLAANQYALTPAQRQSHLEKRLQAHRRGTENLEQQLADGRWVLIKDRRSRDGGYINIYTDITNLKRREQDLEKLLSEHIMLAAATWQSSAGVVVVDVRTADVYPIIYVNPAFERITGYTSAEVCGKDWRKFAELAATSEDARVKIRAAFQARESIQIDTVNVRKHGGKFWNSLAISPVLDERGNLRFYVGVVTDISDRVQIRDMLEERSQMLAEAEHLAHLGHWRWDIQTDKIWRSDEIYRIRGMTPDDAPGDFRGTLNTFHPDDRAMVSGAISGVAVNHQSVEFEARVLRPDGETRHVRIVGQYSPTTPAAGEAVFGIFQDITAQKQQEAALRRSERRYRRLMEAVPHGITEIGVDGTIAYANQSHHKMLGFQRGELIGKSIFDLVADPVRQAELRRRLQMLTRAETYTQAFTSRYLTVDGHSMDVQVDAVISRNENGKVNGVIAVVTDITERLQSEQRLRYLAFYDPLTGLGNRTLLQEHLRDQLAQRREDTCVAVVLFNIDSFKMINDVLGHGAGDAVLREFGARLAAKFDNQDNVARLGEDEFAAILQGEFDRDELRVRAQELKNALEAPLQLSGSRLDIHLSAGVSMAPHDGNDAEELLRNADSALLDAKRDTPGGLRFYNAETKALVEEFLMLRGRLRSAALQGEFYLEYQPQVELESGAITGLEALMRWRTEDGTLIPPGKFIAIAEQSGDIIALGGWVLETACRQWMSWKNLGIAPVPLTVNISARQFLQDDLVQTIKQTLERTGFDPRQLCLELTETTLMTANPGVLQHMQALTAMGIRFSLDDFGTGYSSLSYLNRFPISVLKIDRSFVTGMSLDSRHVAVVSAVVAMSHAFGLEVVAEGIEELRQVENLRATGCHVGQGFFYSRPVSADSCAVLLRAGVIRPRLHG